MWSVKRATANPRETRNKVGRDVASDSSESDNARVGNLHGSVIGRGVATPNDPKLSDGGAWRGACPTVERTADAQL